MKGKIKRMTSAGINGFGRFAFGLFNAWFEDENKSYEICFINDDELTIDDIIDRLRNDYIIPTFTHLKIEKQDDVIVIYNETGGQTRIKMTTGPILSSSWLGKPDIIFETSGRDKNFAACKEMLVEETKRILICAVSNVADSILVIGHNHESFDPTKDK